jgi:release factor glutamine methyltransferase
MGLSEVKRQWLKSLEAANLDRREADAMLYLLMEDLLNISRIDYLTRPKIELTSIQINLIESALNRVIAGEPLQHILGHVLFVGLDLRVGPDALIPRPETEELFELAASSVLNPARVLDVGTGSGALALAWKSRFPDSEVWALDFSKQALALAQDNAKENELEVNWIQMDFLNSAERKRLPEFDLILSNPPYIPEKEKVNMEHRVLDHEPHMALFVPDSDPLLFYRTIANLTTIQSDEINVFLEVYPPLAHGVKDCFSSQKGESSIIKDLSGKDRFVHYSR